VSATAAQGFRAAGVAAGLKGSGGRDVALVVNDGPSFAAAGVFTRNRVKAAPVLWSQQVLTAGVVRAVVLNSGGANACTGSDGFLDTHRTAELVGSLLGIGAGDIAVCSTGLIGLRLPTDRLFAGVAAAHDALSPSGGGDAAAAIMTTDSVPKTAVAPGAGFVVGGMAKGAGMLAPSLATMLVVVTTDAVADARTLDSVLRAAARVTFDRIDSDGCTSTNDTVLLLASGASQVSPSYDELLRAVTDVCGSLARQLIADAEGASKDVRIDVVHAATEDDAVEAGRAISRANLVKCAIHGEDPNWGRILAELGMTAAAFEPDSVDVAINGVWVCCGGATGDDRDLVDMSGREVTLTIDLAAGEASATIWTNDLTAAYVHENSAYSS
jgi:glutamate N-acetyltransferase/amino-acid N-acetyltransferase